MAELSSGGPGVEVEGVVFQADGLNGRVEAVDDAERSLAPAGEASPAERVVAALLLGIEERDDVSVGAAFEVEGEVEETRGGDEAATVAMDVATDPDEVPVLLGEDADGLLTWQLPDGYDPATATAEREGLRGDEQVSSRFTVSIEPTGPAEDERGLVSLVAKKVLRVVAVKLLDPVLHDVGKALARRMERDRHHRLRRFGPDSYHQADVSEITADELRGMAAAGPVLLFVHGTNSLSHSGFGRIPAEVLGTLADRYGGRVLAFDHPTLSVGPAANADELAGRLPADLGMVADVVAHSRGGLVARELVERKDRHALTGKLDVRQVVFVGTPNAGTPFCQPEHLTKYVDMLTNGLSLLPDNGVTDAVDGVMSLLSIAVRGTYEGVPGAMAMNPDGEYLTDLNEAPDPGTCRYVGIVADFEPGTEDGWKLHARNLIVDKVMGGKANDLIIPTESTWEATSLPMAATVRLEPDRHVDHSGYWTSADWRTAIEGWLTAGSLP